MLLGGQDREDVKGENLVLSVKFRKCEVRGIAS